MERVIVSGRPIYAEAEPGRPDAAAVGVAAAGRATEGWEG